MAQQLNGGHARVYFDGCWIQKTAADGGDRVTATYEGRCSRSGSQTWSDAWSEDKDDRNNNQEMYERDLHDFDLIPYSQAVVILGMFGSSNSIDLGGIVNGIAAAAGLVTAIGSALGEIAPAAVNYDSFADACVEKWRGADGYVGAVRCDLICDGNGNTQWTVYGIDNSTGDRGINGAGSWGTTLHSTHTDAEYWPKIGVKAY